MSTLTTSITCHALAASFSREWTSHRLNRFLHAHLGLTLAAGSLVVLTPNGVGGAVWWVLHAVLYAVSLSALLLGLSSAQAEADEFPLLLTQPAGPGAWVAGKAIALVQIVVLSSFLLVLPAFVVGDGSRGLVSVALGAAGLSAVCAVLGLALGFWIRDAVRGLVAAVGIWFALLFGTDLLLLGLGGVPFLQAHPSAWVAPLMLNPLDAFRVTVLFGVEHAAFSGLSSGQLAGWWIQHAGAWLGALLAGWMAFASFLAWFGARRRSDG